VSALGPRRPRLRLDSQAYARLHRAILQRDRWRCQSCGSTTKLEVHHISARSKLDDDKEENLITLCRTCHQAAHFFNKARLQSVR